MKHNGLTLVALIMIVVVLAIIVGGITAYITEGLRLDISNINRQKALAMAQAGIIKGLIDFKNSGNISWDKQNFNVNEFYYSLGEDANFLEVDASSILANGRVVNRWPIKNINATTSITITSLVVNWTFGGRLLKAKLGNTWIFTGPATPSPATVNLSPNFTLLSQEEYPGTNDQYLQFDTGVLGSVSVTFNFSDNSSFKTRLLNNGNEVNKEFSIKVTGKIQSDSIVWARRTLVATYDTAVDKITSWEESQNHLP